MREIHRVQHNVAEEWRGETVEVSVNEVGHHNGVPQATGWYHRTIRIAQNTASPFAGLARFLKAEDRDELARMQPVRTERVKVIIGKNQHGVLPEVGERWSVVLTGATETPRGLLLFGQVTTIVAEAESGHPLVRKLERFGATREWCLIRASRTIGYDDDAETTTFQYKGKFVSATMTRDDNGHPVVALMVERCQRRRLFYDEDLRSMDWTYWNDDAQSLEFKLHAVRDLVQDDRFIARSDGRRWWEYDVIFADDESDD